MNPGVYDDMTNMAYHAHTDWVSSSMLKRMLPEWYGPEPANKKALWFGSAFHTRVLGGPSEPWSVGDFLTWDSKAAKEHAQKAETAGEIPVLARDVDLIENMAKAVENHSEASNLIYGPGGRSEVSVFAEVDSVPMRARFDRITGNGVVVDLKSTSEKPSPTELAKAVIRYGYELSASHYWQVAEHGGIDITGFVLVFVGKEYPHHVSVASLDDPFWERGYALRDLGLQRFLHPEFTDSYPGETGTVTLELPRWAEL